MKQIHFPVLYSTNDYLKDNYKDIDNFTFVSADKQTKARGRNNRKWDSDEGSLSFSLLIKNKEYFNSYSGISIVAAYTILEVIKEYIPNDVMIKWPNDVLVDGKKICGILLESISTNEIECLIIGVGINVNQVEFINKHNIEATSLRILLSHEVNINELKQKVYTKLLSNLDKLINGYDYSKQINVYNYLLNKEVYALINDKKQKVTVKSINQDYSLNVIVGEKEVNINSGEITFHI